MKQGPMCLDTSSTPAGASTDLVQGRKVCLFAWILIHEGLNEVLVCTGDGIV